jgi:hypothetical protein
MKIATIETCANYISNAAKKALANFPDRPFILNYLD